MIFAIITQVCHVFCRDFLLSLVGIHVSHVAKFVNSHIHLNLLQLLLKLNPVILSSTAIASIINHRCLKLWNCTDSDEAVVYCCCMFLLFFLYVLWSVIMLMCF